MGRLLGVLSSLSSLFFLFITTAIMMNNSVGSGVVLDGGDQGFNGKSSVEWG